MRRLHATALFLTVLCCLPCGAQSRRDIADLAAPDGDATTNGQTVPTAPGGGANTATANTAANAATSNAATANNAATNTVSPNAANAVGPAQPIPANNAAGLAPSPTPQVSITENNASSRTTSTATSSALATPAPTATVAAPTPAPTLHPTPAVSNKASGASTSNEAASTAHKPPAAVKVSPLWKVGAVALTLFGLVVMVAFAPNFSAFPSPLLGLAGISAGFAAGAQVIDTFAGASPAASAAQCLLAIAGFGGLTVSGILDGHRNRTGSGALWLAASALLTHSIASPAQGAGMMSGILGALSALGALTLSALCFLPEEEEVATAGGADVVPAAVRAVSTPARTPPPATRTPSSSSRTAPGGRGASRAGGKSVARLIAVEGTLKAQVYTLREGANAVGKDATALDGNKVLLDGDNEVARLHAIIMCGGNRCAIAGTGAANGIVLNGGQVMDERDLMNGDRIQIGGTTFLYQRE